MPEKYPEVIVSTFIINDRKELFLVKGAKWQNQYVIPGGHLNYAETLEDCCKREVKEETNLNVRDLEFFTCSEGIKPQDYSKKDVHFVYLYFIARAENNNLVMDEREGKEYIWISPEESLKSKNIHPGIKDLIKKLIKQKGYQ
ncbi:MAG TPA: NUDIX domain-containing protein [Patescibacteria group bacterium]|nr:NUDIX domain-containing protein [Patescibacteria group bacterium]